MNKIVLNSFLLSSCFLIYSCSKGTSSNNNPNDGNLSTEQYTDIYNPETGIHLSTNRLPSQFISGSDLQICSTGQAYILDQCWDQIIINADQGSISGLKFNSQITKTFLKMNENLDDSLKSFYNFKITSSYEYRTKCDTSTSLYGRCYNTYANPGSDRQYFRIPYISNAGTSWPRVSLRSITGEWTTSSVTEVTPWATSNEITIDEKSNQVISYGIKTLFAYGVIKNLKYNPLQTQNSNPYQIKHYWDINGYLIINSKKYSLPLHFSDLENDIKLENIGGSSGYMDAKRALIGDYYVIFYPESNTKYSYLEYFNSNYLDTGKIKGIVFTPKWDSNIY